MLIPVEIDNQEYLVRFIFNDHFKKKNVIPEKLIVQEIFLDSRGSGVSLQRSYYTHSNFCKNSAKQIASKVYVGFIFFLKESYVQACEEFQKVRTGFQSELKFTPLDENADYLTKIDNIDTEQKGNPSHSDIFYIDPEFIKLEGEQTPNVALRLFSKILSSKCKLFIDQDPNQQEDLPDDLNEIIISANQVVINEPK